MVLTLKRKAERANKFKTLFSTKQPKIDNTLAEQI